MQDTPSPSDAAWIRGGAAPLLSGRSLGRRRRRPHPTGQIELALGPALPRPDGLRRRRSHLAPQTRRLAIAAEAFDEAPPLEGVTRRRCGGLLEGTVAMLATLVCGLGWAAYELERTPPADAWDPLYARTAAGPHDAATGAANGAAPGAAQEWAIRWSGEAASAAPRTALDAGRGPGSSKP